MTKERRLENHEIRAFDNVADEKAKSIIVRLESTVAAQRQIIDEQVEENRGLRNDVLLMQKEDTSQRALIAQQAKEIQDLEKEVKAAMKIIHEMGRHAAKEVRFTTAEFEAWQKGRT